MATRPWEAMAPGYDLRSAWRRDDPKIEADAIAFWNRLGILPPDVAPEERAKQLTSVAYKDGSIVGVHTVALERLELVRARLAMLRTAVDPAHRRSKVSMALTLHTRDLLERWALDHPEERLGGLGAVIEGPNLFDRAREPWWPITRSGVAGYAEDGRQIRISWFDHFRLDESVPPVAIPKTPPPVPDGIALRPAWGLAESPIHADAIAFWSRLGILPNDVTPEERAKELVLAAYRGDCLVGVATAELGILPQVRARLAMMRVAVDPELRRTHIAQVTLVGAKRLLEAWSAEHPHERLAGIGGIVEAPELRASQNYPLWPANHLDLIGFTPGGRQIRVAWFEHFRLD